MDHRQEKTCVLRLASIDIVFLLEKTKHQIKMKGYKEIFGGDGYAYYLNYGDVNTNE